MKTLLVRLSKSISVIAFPGVMLLLPTYSLAVQVGYAVLLLLVTHRSVQEWRSPETSRTDRVIAALAISGVMLSGLLFMLMAASMLHQVIHRPSAPAARLA
jgi:hypothetical protein